MVSEGTYHVSRYTIYRPRCQASIRVFLGALEGGDLLLPPHDLPEGREPKNARRQRQAYGAERRSGPPREGPALLQGLIPCGKCGRRMHVNYRRRFQRLEGCCRWNSRRETPDMPHANASAAEWSIRRSLSCSCAHSLLWQWNWHSRSSTSSGNAMRPSTSCEGNGQEHSGAGPIQGRSNGNLADGCPEIGSGAVHHKQAND